MNQYFDDRHLYPNDSYSGDKNVGLLILIHPKRKHWVMDIDMMSQYTRLAG